MIITSICVSVYFVSVFMMRIFIKSRFKTRITKFDLIFILAPVLNTLIMIGKIISVIYILVNYLTRLFIKWFINGEYEVPYIEKKK